jgi:hypothetical protein
MIASHLLVRVFLSFVLLLAVGRAFGDERFTPLLARVPSTANSLTMIDVSKVFASEMAVRLGWRQEHARKFDASPSMLPPTTEQFIWASELDLKYMNPIWQVAAMNLSQDLSMEKLARWIRGERDMVAGLEAVATPRGGMVVKFSQREYGVIKPGNRQKAARWISESGRNREQSSSLSPYLAFVVADPTRTGADLLKAIDLTDALDRPSIRAALNNSQVVKQAGLNPDEVADLLAGVRGLTVGVQFADRAAGKFVVDFKGSVAVLGQSAKPLLLEVLAEAGASFDELPSWTLTLGDRQFALQGEMTESGLRRLFSFLETDAAVVDQGTQDAGGADIQASASEIGSLTREYFRSVTKFLDDLSGERGANSYGTIALWFEKYARRIEALPILNIDPDMLSYSASVVSHFRGAADSIRAGGIKTGARTAQISSADYGYGNDYGYYGYPVFSGSTNYAVGRAQAAEADRRAIRAEERAASSLDARGHVSQVKDESSAIRRQMTERYQMEF